MKKLWILLKTVASESSSQMRGIPASDLDLYPTNFNLKTLNWNQSNISVYLSYNSSFPSDMHPVSVFTVKPLGLLAENYQQLDPTLKRLQNKFKISISVCSVSTKVREDKTETIKISLRISRRCQGCPRVRSLTDR